MSRAKPPTEDLIRQRLRRHLEVLKLDHILERLDAHLAWAIEEQPSPSALFERVLGEQAAFRLEQRVARRVGTSGLPELKSFEAFDWKFQPKLDKRVVLELAHFGFVEKKEDLLITGKTGTGKSHILQALALRACHEQIRVRYARCIDLLNDLYAGLADGSYLQRMKGWTSPALLVIDDVGLGQVKKREDEPTAAHALFDLLDRRHGRGSTAMSSNITLSQWGRYLGDATLAAAILDRVVMRARRIHIDGPSYRQHLAEQRAALAKAELEQEALS